MSIKFKPIYTRYLQFKVFARILFVRIPYLVILSFQGEWQQASFRTKYQPEKIRHIPTGMSDLSCVYHIPIMCLSCVTSFTSQYSPRSSYHKDSQ